jgi:hypothetical protein
MVESMRALLREAVSQAVSASIRKEARHELARLEAARARRQYDAADSDNQLVVGELERRSNERLKEERTIDDELDALSAAAWTSPGRPSNDRSPRFPNALVSEPRGL